MKRTVHGACLFACFALTVVHGAAVAGQHGGQARQGESAWSWTLRGGYAYQFDADLDQGGSFATSRLFLEGGPTYRTDRQRAMSLVLGYGYESFDFGGSQPGNIFSWEGIHTLRLSCPVRWGTGDKWTWMVVPTIRLAAEETADWEEGVSGGAFAGFTYRFNDRLTLGPGLGILSQIEDDATVFPILIISWQMTDRLSLETGRGLAATQGPGLTLHWEHDPSWRFSLGGRYEKQRFRLAADGPVPAGVAEDVSFPVYVGASYDVTEKFQASLVGGLELGGSLRVEDEQGRLVKEDDYQAVPFVAVTFSGRF